MSKALARVRALVSEIDAIQTEGRKNQSVPLMKAVQNVQPEPVPQAAPSPVSYISPQTEQMSQVQAGPAPVVTPSPAAEASKVTPIQTATQSEGRVFLQLTGKVAIQLQLEHSEEIVEVRQIGETIEIRFNDGKAIHLPLKSVA